MNKFSITDAILAIDHDTVDKTGVAVLVENRLKEATDEAYKKGYKEGLGKADYRGAVLDKIFRLCSWIATIGAGLTLVLGLCVFMPIACARNAGIAESKAIAACSAGNSELCLDGWRKEVDNWGDVEPPGKAMEAAYFQATGKILVPDNIKDPYKKK